MKILQVAPYFIPYPGGQERYVFNLSKFLTKMGHEVHVLTSNYPKGEKFEECEGITVERHDVFARPLRNPLALGFLKMGKKFNEFDIVHIHNEHSFPAMVAANIKRKYNIPLVLTCHGQLLFGDKFADAFESFYSKTIGKRVFKAADLIIALSQADKEYITSLINESEKIKILPNAIDPDFLGITNKYKSEYDTIEEFKLLYVGKLIRRKGLEWLIKALGIINMYDKKFICIIVGEGEDEKYFKELTKKYHLEDIIIFKGRIEDKELINLYKSSQAFILPSLSEGCPTVILEAMYFGLPVISTNIPGIKEHFNNSTYLVPPKDEKILANAIINLIDNMELCKSLSEKGQKLVHSKYIWDKVAREYEIIYESLFAQSLIK